MPGSILLAIACLMGLVWRWIFASLLILKGWCKDGDEETMDSNAQELDPEASHSGHSNNWAVLVCTSTFWFNYRHVANALSLYLMAKGLGIPDDHIILMLADDMACNGRNKFQGQVFGRLDKELNLYGDDVEVDYRGCEVTVDMFVRLLTNRLPPHFPKSKRLLTDSSSNILVYMTGHGGNNFLKFQDSEEINAYDIADAFEQMWKMNRYNEILFIIDTCQASTMFERIRSPNIMAISSSSRSESSFSYHVDDDIGVAIIDRFTHSLLNYLSDTSMHSKKTVANFMKSLDLSFLGSKPELRSDLFNRDADLVKLIDFFGNVQPVVVGGSPLTISESLTKAPVQPLYPNKQEDSSLEEPIEPIDYSTFSLVEKQTDLVQKWLPRVIGTAVIGLVATGCFFF